jgi:hypothetical protein
MVIHDFRNPTNQFEFQIKNILKEFIELKKSLQNKQNINENTLDKQLEELV